ncbi:MAG: gamma-glutamyl-phosphate reductase, partial [Solirubrobacter sp.]
MAQIERLRAEVVEIGKRAKTAAAAMATLSTEQKNNALISMAEALVANAEHILAANEKDMEAAAAAGIGSSLLDRLMLTSVRVKEMAEGLYDVAVLT